MYFLRYVIKTFLVFITALKEVLHLGTLVPGTGVCIPPVCIPGTNLQTIFVCIISHKFHYGRGTRVPGTIVVTTTVQHCNRYFRRLYYLVTTIPLATSLRYKLYYPGTGTRCRSEFKQRPLPCLSYAYAYAHTNWRP